MDMSNIKGEAEQSQVVIAWLEEQLRARAYRHQPERPFLLASGRMSEHYVDCRKVLSEPAVLSVVGMQIMRRAVAVGATAIGGPAMGAAPLVYSASVYSWVKSRNVADGLTAFMVRKEAKDHGTGGMVIGSVSSGHHAVVVDDVLTSGGSLIGAIRACQQEGIFVAAALVLVDREEGGAEAVEEQTGVRVGSIIKMSALMPEAEPK